MIPVPEDVHIIFFYGEGRNWSPQIFEAKILFEAWTFGTLCFAPLELHFNNRKVRAVRLVYSVSFRLIFGVLESCCTACTTGMAPLRLDYDFDEIWNKIVKVDINISGHRPTPPCILSWVRIINSIHSFARASRCRCNKRRLRFPQLLERLLVISAGTSYSRNIEFFLTQKIYRQNSWQQLQDW